jgi:hypothetical protein
VACQSVRGHGPADRPRDPVPEDPQDRGRGAEIELGRLLELARSGRNPDSGVTVAELLDAYVPVAGWEVSTEEANLGYIRRTIKPALGTKEVRKVRGPLLDNLYARLQKCGDLACAGKPFTEHRHVPDLRPGSAGPKTQWQQTAGGRVRLCPSVAPRYRLDATCGPEGGVAGSPVLF